MSQPKAFGPLDLAKLDAPLGEVKLRSGRVVGVRAADGKVFRALELLYTVAKELVKEEETGATPNVAAHAEAIGKAAEVDIWELVARCLPDATPEEVAALSATECHIVFRIAQGRLESLLREVAAAEAGKAGAAPSPETGSPTSASSSLGPPASPSGAS